MYKQTKIICLYKQIKLTCLYIQTKTLCMYTQIKGSSPLFMWFCTKYLFCLHTQTNYFARITCVCALCARARYCPPAKYLVFGVCRPCRRPLATALFSSALYDFLYSLLLLSFRLIEVYGYAISVEPRKSERKS